MEKEFQGSLSQLGFIPEFHISEFVWQNLYFQIFLSEFVFQIGFLIFFFSGVLFQNL